MTLSGENKFDALRNHLADRRITNLAAIGTYAIDNPEGLMNHSLFKERLIKHELLESIRVETEEIDCLEELGRLAGSTFSPQGG